MLSKNIGTVDRVLRIVVGLLLIAYAIPIGFPETGWNWTGWLGVPLVLTALIRICPAYSLFRISTRKA